MTLRQLSSAFGGRGSTLFKLLWEKDSAFRNMALRLRDHPGEVKVYFSTEMKHEAAKGMLAPDLKTLEPDGTNRSVVGIGARIDSNEEVNAMTFIDDVKTSLACGAEKQDRQRDNGDFKVEVEMEAFVSRVQEVGKRGGFGIEVERAAMQTIAMAGEDAFSRLREESTEPPFIAMLRTTLSLIYEGKSIKTKPIETKS